MAAGRCVEEVSVVGINSLEPEIVTFDELFGRAEWSVALAAASSAEPEQDP